MSTCTEIARMSEAQRIEALIKDARAGGVPKRMYITLIALSGRECGYQWFTERTGDTRLLYVDCWSCRTCVGYEPSSYNGKSVWNSAITQEQAVVNFMDRMGMLKKTDYSTGSSGRRYYPVSGNIGAPNGPRVQQMFELMLVAREAALLPAFSIGPTQMWLGQSPLSNAYIATQHFPVEAAGNVPTFPATWDDLASFYSAPTVPALMSHMTPYYESSFMPADNPADRESIIAWIQRKQTGGSVETATAYYTSTFATSLSRIVAVDNAPRRFTLSPVFSLFRFSLP